MRFVDHSNLLLFSLFVLLIAFVCAPIWWVGTFVNQDGTPHLYNAYLIGELLKGNQSVAAFAALNEYPIPNLTGHWLLAALLPILGPTITTKVAVTSLFAIFVASVVWLRLQTAGREGIAICMVLAAAIGMNWPWLLGFYNFILALSTLTFTLGLWWRWRENITVLRAAGLMILFVFTFFSHLVSFGLLGFCLLILIIVNYRSLGRKDVMLSVSILVLTAPLAFNFLLLGLSEGGFHPTWRSLDESSSLVGLFRQLSAADPFALMTRRSIPFVELRSGFLTLFAPSLWIGVAMIALLGITFRRGRISPSRRGWLVAAVILFAVSVVGPDDFGSAHGGFLRERVVLVSLICSIPFLRFETSGYSSKFAAAALLFVVLFQTGVVWEYSIKADSIAKHFLAAKEQIKTGETLGSVVFAEGDWRFRPIPSANLSPIIGIGKNIHVWDNYELGYYLFPVVSPTRQQQEFIVGFREASTYDLNDPNEDIRGKLTRLETFFETESWRFSTLLVWNEIPEFTPIREKWFNSEPYFVSGHLKLYTRR